MTTPRTRTARDQVGRHSTALALVIGVLTLPPGLLSQQGLAPVGGLVIVSAGMCFLLIGRGRRTPLLPPFPPFLGVLLAFQVWVLILVQLTPSPTAGFVVQSVVIVMVVVLAATPILSDTDLAQRSARMLIAVLAVAGYSGLITWLLLVGGVPGERLTLMPIKLYEAWSPDSRTPLYFPFTPEAGTVRVGGVTLPRSAGVLREPGLSQLFLVVALVLARRLRVRRVLIGGLGAGIVTSGSTAAVVSLTTVVLVLLVLRDRSVRLTRHYLRSLGAVLVMLSGLWAATSLPGVGAFGSDKAADSVEARSEALAAGLESMSRDPWGTGMGRAVGDAGINLIGQGAEFGIPGVALICAGYLSLGLWPRPARRPMIAVCGVVVLTGLTSQPLFNMPGMYLLLMMAAAATWSEFAVTGQSVRVSSGFGSPVCRAVP